MVVLTVRGVSEETFAALRGEADAQARSLNRHIIVILEERAALLRRASELGRTRRRLDALRPRVLSGQSTTTDSAALLWAERGGR